MTTTRMHNCYPLATPHTRPAVLAEVLVSRLGLISTFEILGSIVAGIERIVACEVWRT
jgi:hypothetical protein